MLSLSKHERVRLTSFNSKSTPSGVARQLVTFLVLPRKVTKRSRPRCATPSGFPALLGQPGLRINSHDPLRGHVLKHMRRKAPGCPALLGGAQGKERRRSKPHGGQQAALHSGTLKQDEIRESECEMMRCIFWIIFVSAGMPLNAMSAGSGQNVVQREEYQKVVEAQFSGFRILNSEDFFESVRVDVKDGASGALVVGDFDFDHYKDFAALLIGGVKSTYKPDATRSIKVYEGMAVICHGSEKAGIYSCQELGKADYYGFSYSALYIVPPGSYECMEEEGKAKSVVTKISSVGEYSEQGGGFSVLKSNGKYFTCVDSD